MFHDRRKTVYTFFKKSAHTADVLRDVVLKEPLNDLICHSEQSKESA